MTTFNNHTPSISFPISMQHFTSPWRQVIYSLVYPRGRRLRDTDFNLYNTLLPLQGKQYSSWYFLAAGAYATQISTSTTPFSSISCSFSLPLLWGKWPQESQRRKNTHARLDFDHHTYLRASKAFLLDGGKHARFLWSLGLIIWMMGNLGGAGVSREMDFTDLMTYCPRSACFVIGVLFVIQQREPRLDRWTGNRHE